MRAAVLSLHGAAAPVVDYDGMLADSVRFTQVVCEYLEGIGVGLGHDESNAFLTCLDVNVRHHDQAEFESIIGVHREEHAILTERTGTLTVWEPPELVSEPPRKGGHLSNTGERSWLHFTSSPGLARFGPPGRHGAFWEPGHDAPIGEPVTFEDGSRREP